jgi:hypothetical protein
MKMTVLNRRVQIIKGMREFIGKFGTVVDIERSRNRPAMFRIRFDEPVEIMGLDPVEDDLWERPGFRTVTPAQERAWRNAGDNVRAQAIAHLAAGFFPDAALKMLSYPGVLDN